MKTFINSLKLFRRNLSAIVVFELMYKLMSVAILAPLFYFILNFSVKAAGIKYLSAGTMSKYFKAPSTYLLFLCLLFLLAMYLLINISAIIYAHEASYRNEKTNSVSMLFRGILNALRIINPRNFGVILYVLFVLPFTYTVMISGSIIGIKLPEFFNRFIRQNKVALIILMIVYIFLCIIWLSKIFSLNYFTVYKIDYKDSVVISKKAIKKHTLKILFGIILYNLVITSLLFLLEGTLATVLAGVLRKFINYKKFNFIFNIIIQISFFVLYAIGMIVSTPLIYSYICTCFYEYEDGGDYSEYQHAKERRYKNKKDLSPKQIRNKNRLVVSIAIILSICFNCLYIYLSINDKIDLNVAYSTRAAVTAHRGDSGNAPENTMSAIKLAVENQADIIEIDVRQTSDGEFIIMHDESLYRTTGVDKKVGEVPFDYIRQLDVGKYFSDDYIGEIIPTLEEVLIYGIEADIFYNIELKPASTDKNYVDGIVSLIEAYDYIDNCVVASSDYDVIKSVKLRNEDIKTVYIMSMAFGEFGDMEYVDIFSIRHNFISNDIVRDIHKNGKEIYAWTVNNENDIKELLLLDVDSVITDYPYETKDIIYNANDTIISDWIERIVNEY